MCGVHAMVVMPSSTAMRAICSDMSRLRDPSSMPGRMWLWRSITAGVLLAPEGTQIHAGKQGCGHGVRWNVHVEFDERVHQESEQADAAHDRKRLLAAQPPALARIAHQRHGPSTCQPRK